MDRRGQGEHRSRPCPREVHRLGPVRQRCVSRSGRAQQARRRGADRRDGAWRKNEGIRRSARPCSVIGAVGTRPRPAMAPGGSQRAEDPDLAEVAGRRRRTGSSSRSPSTHKVRWGRLSTVATLRSWGARQVAACNRGDEPLAVGRSAATDGSSARARETSPSQHRGPTSSLPAKLPCAVAWASRTGGNLAVAR